MARSHLLGMLSKRFVISACTLIPVALLFGQYGGGDLLGFGALPNLAATPGYRSADRCDNAELRKSYEEYFACAEHFRVALRFRQSIANFDKSISLKTTASAHFWCARAHMDAAVAAIDWEKGHEQRLAQDAAREDARVLIGRGVPYESPAEAYAAALKHINQALNVLGFSTRAQLVQSPSVVVSPRALSAAAILYDTRADISEALRNPVSAAEDRARAERARSDAFTLASGYTLSNGKRQ